MVKLCIDIDGCACVEEVYIVPVLQGVAPIDLENLYVGVAVSFGEPRSKYYIKEYN